MILHFIFIFSMNRIDRLHAILTHLQSKKRVTAKELSDRFELSLRTVYRDIKALEESGVPIIGEAGIGYQIMEGYRLPPVMFTQEEAGAILLSAKLAEHLTDDSINKHLFSALCKIKAVLKSHDKTYLEELNDRVFVYARKSIHAENASYLINLQKALIENRVIEIKYLSPYKDGPTLRKIEPIGLFYYGATWHLIGWCRLRNGHRDFRVSRIEKLVVTEEKFAANNHHSLEQYLQAHKPGNMREMVVIFRKDIARHITDQRYLHGFVSEEILNDLVRMRFMVGHIDYFARWLLAFTNAVKIESPEALKFKMQELIGEIQDLKFELV